MDFLQALDCAYFYGVNQTALDQMLGFFYCLNASRLFFKSVIFRVHFFHALLACFDKRSPNPLFF